MAIKKHFGKFGADQCIIVFREIPGDSEHCLIVIPDQLEEGKREVLINVVNGPEAQSVADVSEVLNKVSYPNGSIILQELHTSRRLQKASVDMVEVVPNNTQTFPLRVLNEEMKKVAAGYKPPVNALDNVPDRGTPEGDPGPQTKITTEDVDVMAYDGPGLKEAGTEVLPDGAVLETDPQANQARIDAQSQDSIQPANDEQMAASLIQQASLMREDAAAMLREADDKLEQAYQKDPSLRPVVETIAESPETSS